MKNRLGVHIRMRSSLRELIHRADSLDLSFFQCFFVPQESGKLIQPSFADMREFVKIRRERFKELVCHISYWVNLARLRDNGYIQLRREIAFAKRLEFTHFVLHAGSAKGALDKMQGIDALAKALNNLLKSERDITILLENTCHGNLAVGSDITDFALLREKLDRPEKIGFCLDTAHAHSWGYDIATVSEQQKFVELLATTIGLESIKLIHLNDTVEKLGSRIDRHGIMGAGEIGEDALKSLVTHPQLSHIPLIMELPELTVEEERAIVKRVREW